MIKLWFTCQLKYVWKKLFAMGRKSEAFVLQTLNWKFMETQTWAHFWQLILIILRDIVLQTPVKGRLKCFGSSFSPVYQYEKNHSYSQMSWSSLDHFSSATDKLEDSQQLKNIFSLRKQIWRKNLKTFEKREKADEDNRISTHSHAITTF